MLQRFIAASVSTGWARNWHTFCTHYNLLTDYKILTDFQTYFTVRIIKKFVIILSVKIPSHLQCVATLPCQYFKSNN